MEGCRWLITVETVPTQACDRHYRLWLHLLDQSGEEPEQTFHSVEELFDALMAGREVHGSVLLEE